MINNLSMLQSYVILDGRVRFPARYDEDDDGSKREKEVGGGAKESKERVKVEKNRAVSDAK